MTFSRVLLISLLSAFLLTSVNANAARSDSTNTDAPTKQHVQVKNSTQPVNINTADANELTTLKGLGAKKAQAIIDYRNQHGKFASIDGLANVKGIGKKGLERLLKNNPERIEVANLQ